MEIAQELGHYAERPRSRIASTYNAVTYYETTKEVGDTIVVAEWPRYNARPMLLLDELPNEAFGNAYLSLFRRGDGRWEVGYERPGGHCPVSLEADTLGDALVLLAEIVLL
jgi:hypothetical protein